MEGGHHIPENNPALQIRPARPDEAACLTGLAMRSKAVWGYDAEFMARCRPLLAVTETMIEAAPVFVLDAGGTVAGFYALTPLDAAQIDLALLFVEPRHLGNGYGRRLWDHAVALAGGPGFPEMIIESDPNALGFYAALGARPAGFVASPAAPGRRLPRLRFDLKG